MRESVRAPFLFNRSVCCRSLHVRNKSEAIVLATCSFRFVCDKVG